MIRRQTRHSARHAITLASAAGMITGARSITKHTSSGY